MKKVLSTYFPYIFLFIVFIAWNLFIFPLDIDEIINYGFAHNIYNGLIPYIDFNLTTTPLYSILMSAPFHIFGSSILVFHLTNIILLLAICFLLLKFFRKKAWLIILLFFLPLPNLVPNYTWLLLFFYLLLLYLENEEDKDFIIGFIIGLMILTKQDVGLFMLLPSLIFLKEPLKLIKRGIGAIIPVIVFLLYLLFTRALPSFIELCLSNIKLGNIISIYAIIVLILIYFTYRMIRKNPQDIENYYTLAFYTIIIPFFDYEHLKFCLIAFAVIYLLNSSKVYKKFAYTFFSTTLIICITIVGAMMFFQKNNYPNNINHFQYRLIPRSDVYETEILSNYLTKNVGNSFVSLNTNSYYIKIVNDIKINKLDLLTEENWGKNGKKIILNIIKNNKNIMYVIDRSAKGREKEYYKTAIKYVKKHGIKIKTIGNYDLYVLK